MMHSKKMANGGKAKHSDAKQDKTMMTKVAKGEVAKHEKTMHGKKMANGGKVKMANGGYAKKMKGC